MKGREDATQGMVERERRLPNRPLSGLRTRIARV